MDTIELQSIKTFLDALASGSPTPGGGGAAALMGAQAAALVSMVCHLTLGKPKYATVQAEIQTILEQSEALRVKFVTLVSDDAVVFNKVMAAYGLAKDSDAEKLIRSEAIQEALKSATDVPLTCAKASAEVLALSQQVAGHGNLNVISDAGVAALAAFGALKSAALNVYVNTGTIKDTAFVESRLAELEKILAGADLVTENVYQLVKSKL